MFQLTAEGHSGGAVAERLFISPRTVESHRANLMRKLGLRNHKELIRYAARRGLLPGRSPADAGEKRGGRASMSPLEIRINTDGPPRTGNTTEEAR